MTIQPENNNLNFFIDPTFTNVIRLFVLPSRTNNVGDNSVSHYYIQNVEIKDFNVLYDRKRFFDFPVKNEEEAYEKIIAMCNINDYTTGKFIRFWLLKKIIIIPIDLSKQTKLKDPSQVSFIGKLENKDHRATMLFIIKKSEETTFNFSQNSITII